MFTLFLAVVVGNQYHVYTDYTEFSSMEECINAAIVVKQTYEDDSKDFTFICAENIK